MDQQENGMTVAYLLGCGLAVSFLVLIAIAALVAVLILAPQPTMSTEAEAALSIEETLIEPEMTPAAEPTVAAEPVTLRVAPPPHTHYTWTVVASGFDNPLYVTHAGDGSGRLFGVEQTGAIWILQDGEVLAEPFIDLSNLLPPDVFRGTYTERGLLGLAFHPNYAKNGLFFVHYTNLDGHSVIARYRVSAEDPNRADPQSGLIILTVEQPFIDHNGGHVAFGPDGYLYTGLGDGGDQGDPFGLSQNPGDLHGKILRLDVDNAPEGAHYAAPPDNAHALNEAFAPEVWHLGLRNPWRFSFDRATGDLYIGDVGWMMREEISFLPADAPAGANFGWNAIEGDLPTGIIEPTEAMIAPVVSYDHGWGCSVTGGYVYRGQMMPELHGVYIFGDYCSGQVWALYRDRIGRWQNVPWMLTGRQISSFGEDEAGELYMVDYKGDILRLEPAQDS
ncbi:MAG: PQQ-dependent sugar dehydrogenase [Aggregatilineales bacterium]